MSVRFMIMGNIFVMFRCAFFVFPVLSETTAAKRLGPMEFIICEFVSHAYIEPPSVWIQVLLTFVTSPSIYSAV